MVVAAKLCQITSLLDSLKDIIHVRNINHAYPQTLFEGTKLQVKTKIHLNKEYDKENILLQNETKSDALMKTPKKIQMASKFYVNIIKVKILRMRILIKH